MDGKQLHTRFVYEMDYAARSDPGIVRRTSQDVARVVPSLRLALVAEQRGASADDVLTCRVFADEVEQSFTRLGGAGSTVDETVEVLTRSFREATAWLLEDPIAHENTARPVVSLVASVFVHGAVIIACFGAPRCYRQRDRVLELVAPVTSLPRPVEESSARNELRTARPRRSLHTFGAPPSGSEGEIRVLRGEPGDAFLLCSDGLWGTVGERTIGDIIDTAMDADEACERLLGAAWVSGGLDSIGVAVVRLKPLELHLDEPPWLQPPAPSDDHPMNDA
jgi:PPM family protein phosphatase